MNPEANWLVASMVAWLLISTQVINAQESTKFEKIRDISPDQKFAMRISSSVEPGRYQQVDLVSLPSKNVVMNLPQNNEADHLIWSQDSKWFAFPSSSGPRVTETYVYHRSGDDFAELKAENLQVDVKGDVDVKNEHVTPVRWVKPSVLLLQQFSIFRSGHSEDATWQGATYRFTAKFDEKTGKFRIISKKKVSSKQ
jgi:hypothetical protein